MFIGVTATVNFLEAGAACKQNKGPAILELIWRQKLNNKQTRTYVVF